MAFKLMSKRDVSGKKAVPLKSKNPMSDSVKTIDTAASYERKEKKKAGESKKKRPLAPASSLDLLMGVSSHDSKKPLKGKGAKSKGKPLPTSGRAGMQRRKSLGSGLNKTGDYGISDLSSASEHSNLRGKLRRQSSDSNLKDAAARAREKRREKEAKARGDAPTAPVRRRSSTADSPNVRRTKSADDPLGSKSAHGERKRVKKTTSSSSKNSGKSEIEILQEKIRKAKAKSQHERRAPPRSKSSGMASTLHAPKSQPVTSGLDFAAQRGQQKAAEIVSKRREEKLEERLQQEQEKTDEMSISLAEARKEIQSLKDENDRINKRLRQEQRDAERTIGEKDKEINELSETVDRILEAEQQTGGMGGGSSARLERELKQTQSKVETLQKVLSARQDENERLATELSCYKDSTKSRAMLNVDSGLVKENADLKDKMKFKDETIDHLMEQLKQMKLNNSKIDGSARLKVPTEMDRSGHGLVSSISNRMNRNAAKKDDMDKSGHGLVSSFADTINRFSPGTLSRRPIPKRADRVKAMQAPAL